MDLNEDIFVRVMNDASLQKTVTAWMAAEAYRRLRGGVAEGDMGAPAVGLPPRLRIVQPNASERYVSCVPLVPLEAAAGALGDPQHVDESGWSWVAIETTHRLRPGMFVAQVIGKSMEPAIADGPMSSSGRQLRARGRARPCSLSFAMRLTPRQGSDTQ